MERKEARNRLLIFLNLAVLWGGRDRTALLGSL